MPNNKRFLNLTGLTFGRLTVIEYKGSSPTGKKRWLCKCNCGSVSVATTSSLRKGSTRSCGCLHREIMASRQKKPSSVRFSVSKHELYGTYRCMLDRCYVKTTTGYKNYGGRGIKVCDRWVDNENSFYEDMGERPKDMSLDRIDTNGNYTPENCRWATYKVQSQNRRDNVLTSDMVVKMRKLHESGRSIRSIWMEFVPNSNYSTVRCAVKSLTWKNLN